MASLYQRGEVWWITYRQDGRRRRETLRTTSRKLAERKKVQLEAELEEGAHRRITPITFEKLLKEFEPYRAGTHDQMTHRSSMGRALRFVSWVGVTKPTSVRPRDVQHFVTMLLTEGLKPQTVNNYLSSVSVLFRHAKTCGYVLENPAEGVPRLNQKRNPIRPYSAEDVEKILSLAKKHSEALWLIMLGARYTGLRAKELRTLLWEDIDFDTEPLAAISVRPSRISPGWVGVRFSGCPTVS